VDDPEFEVLLFEFKADLNRYLSELEPGASVHSLQEVIAFNQAHAAEEMPYFGQDIMEKAQAKGSLTDPKYRKALATCRRLSRAEGIDFTLRKFRVDALVAPTGNPAWPTDLVNGDHFTGGSSTLPAVAGYPHITVPMGLVFGLPVGVSFFAGAWSEPTLIKLAYAYEQATRLRQPPRFLPTLELGKS
jgi:amidase